MDLLQLRYFCESAQNESFSKTAEKYIVPTSSVSAAVKRLEQELGVKLFDRSANRIYLNAKGRMLADALTIAFDQVENAIAEIQNTIPEIPEIRLLVRAKRSWVTDLLIRYKSEHPAVAFRMTHDFDASEFSSYDVIIDEQLEACGNWERFLLSIEKICIKGPKNSPLAGKRLTMRQLREEPFIMMAKSSAMRRILEKEGKRCGFVPNIAVECDDRQCLLQCVEAGMGLTIGSISALKDNGQRNIIPLHVADFCETQLVYVYHRPIQPNEAYFLDFLNFLSRQSNHATSEPIEINADGFDQ